MQVQPINNTSMQGIKFRLPVKSYLSGYNSEHGVIYRHTCNYMKVYENPEAGNLYRKALKTKDIKERTSLLDQMGGYELVDLDKESFWGRMKHKLCEMFINTFL